MEQLNHVLIVDDVPENIQLLGSMLQRRGYRVTLADNGMAALESVKSDPPHLILLDISMPEMDGFEVCTRLKESTATRDIPIIFLSAFSDKGRVVQGFDIGAVDYVTKPFNSAELFARIRTHLDLRFTKELLMQRNQQLQEANEQLHQLNQDKDELLGIVAHDLKSPLSSIRGMIDTLVRNEDLPYKEMQEFHRNIFNTVERMFILISDLLSANALERGGMSFTMMPVDVGDVVQQTIEQYRQAAEAKHLHIHYAHQSGLLAYTDEKALMHILDNLVSNAVKYSPSGKSVTLRLEEHKQSVFMRHGSIRIAVRDEGQGLTDEDKSKLFAKFTRLSAKPTAGEHSTGLGLSIVKKLADAIQARVWCESVFGNGATFIVELPLATPAQCAEFGI